MNGIRRSRVDTVVHTRVLCISILRLAYHIYKVVPYPKGTPLSLKSPFRVPVETIFLVYIQLKQYLAKLIG